MEEERLPAQPALFKLERKWPNIQHASKLPLLTFLSLSPLSSVNGFPSACFLCAVLHKMPEWFLEYCIKSERFASQIQKTLMLSDSFFFFIPEWGRIYVQKKRSCAPIAWYMLVLEARVRKSAVPMWLQLKAKAISFRVHF